MIYNGNEPTVNAPTLALIAGLDVDGTKVGLRDLAPEHTQSALPSLDEIVQYIQHHLDEAKKAKADELAHALAAGDWLIRARERVGQHGRWLPLLNRCGLNERTAQARMKMARHRAQIEAAAKAPGRTYFGIDAARRLIAKKKPTRFETRVAEAASTQGIAPGRSDEERATEKFIATWATFSKIARQNFFHWVGLEGLLADLPNEMRRELIGRAARQSARLTAKKAEDAP